MANYKPNEDYTGETKLRKWWPIIKANIADIYNKLNAHLNGTADRHKGVDVDYSAQMTMTAVIDKETADRQAADNAEKNARIAADNTEKLARITADEREVIARKEAISTLSGEVNHVFEESKIVEEITDTADLWISGDMEIGIVLNTAIGDLKVAGPIFAGEDGELKINGINVDISDVTHTPTQADEWRDDYDRIYMTIYGTITGGNQYVVTDAVTSFVGDDTLVDYKNGKFALRLCEMFYNGTSDMVVENFSRDTDNTVESTRAEIVQIASKDIVDDMGIRLDGLDETVTGLDMTLADVTSNTTLIENSTNGGFAAGNSSVLTDNDCYGTGGAAVGKQATANGGLAGGGLATTCCGLAGGYETWSDGGGAGGAKAYTYDGGSLGQEAYSDDGGAIGCDAKAGNGFSGGAGAHVDQVDGMYIDAIQLGYGTNYDEYTLQAYGYQLMDANGQIPNERMQGIRDDVDGLINNTTVIYNEMYGFNAGESAYTTMAGGAIGNYANANDGGAIGNGASAFDGGAAGLYASTNNGGAIGYNAVSGDGFSGGLDATVATNSDGTYINAIQLGTGANNDENTLQVYSYQLMDANGQIPAERLTDVYDAINALQTAVANLQN